MHGECARVESASQLCEAAKHFHIFPPHPKSFIYSTIARVENWQTKAAVQTLLLSNRYLRGRFYLWCALRQKKRFSAICLFVCGCIPYWFRHLYLNFDMHNVRENRTSSTARFHPELAWVYPRNSFIFLIVWFEFKKEKKNKSVEREGGILLNKLRLRQFLFINLDWKWISMLAVWYTLQ